MKIKQMAIPFELKGFKEQDDTFEFEGHISTFGNVDLGADVIIAGAFAQTLKERMPKFLWQHRHDKVLGIFTEAYEDSTGLYVKGKLPKKVMLSRETGELMKMGALDSFSIGYSVVDFEMKDGIRILKKLNLWEGSVVTFPMNENATLIGIKSVTPYNDLPVAPEGTEWKRAAAIDEVKTWSKDGEEKAAYLHCDNKGSMKLPIAKVVDGKLQAVPAAIIEAAEELKDSNEYREEEKAAMVRNLNRYFEKIGVDSPFKKSYDFSIIKEMKDLNEALKALGLTNSERNIFISKTKDVLSKHRDDADGNEPENEAKTKDPELEAEIEAEMKSLFKKLKPQEQQNART